MVANKKAMFNIYLAKGSDGKKLYSSTDQGTPTQVDDEREASSSRSSSTAWSASRRAPGSRSPRPSRTSGAPAGAPQLKLKTSDTVLFVDRRAVGGAEGRARRPEGQDGRGARERPDGQESGGKVTGIDFSQAPKKAPTKLQVIPLVEGDGPAAKAGRLVTFNYYGAVYGSKKPFDSSFSRGAPVPFGVGVKGLIPAWDKVIPGLKQGSRVLIIAPPGDAYGARAQSGIPANSTLDVRRRRPRCGLLILPRSRCRFLL